MENMTYPGAHSSSAAEQRPPVASPFIGNELYRLSADLDDVSSLLTDVICSMTAGWDKAQMNRCCAFASGAQALVDRLRGICDAHFESENGRQS